MSGEKESDKVETQAAPEQPEAHSKPEEPGEDVGAAAKEEGAPQKAADADNTEKQEDADGKGEEAAPEKSTPTKAKRGKAASGRNPEKTAGSRTSSRARKAVDHFVVEVSQPKAESGVIKEGKGQKLSDIPNIVFHMSKVPGKDEVMNLLHRLLYRRPGKATTRKRDIMAFSGFVYDNKEEEREKDLDKLMKWKLDEIHKLMDWMDMQRGGGSKEEKANRVLDFLEEPSVLSEKDLAEKAAEKKAAVKRKRELEAKKRDKKRAAKVKEAAKKKKAAAKKKTPVKKTKKKAPTPEPESEEGSEEEDMDDEEEEEELEEEEEVEPPKKKAKAATPSKAKTSTPTSKLSAPGEKEITDAAIEILQTVDLEVLSMKNLMAKLQDMFGQSMAPYKGLLKRVAVEYVHKHR